VPVPRFVLFPSERSKSAHRAPRARSPQVDALVAENAVVMFSFSGCPFCKSAKKLLDAEGAKYTAVELDQMGLEGKALRAELGRRTGRTSQPNIFIAGRGIGGCNDGTPGLVPLQKSGELRPLLQAAGAL
jgi:glutaredoxin 3